MHRNNELYHFLLERTHSLTEQWYKSLDKKKSSGIYASNDPEVIEMLKKQNYEFHLCFCKVFDESCSEVEFLSAFDQWIYATSKDEGHQRTPIHLMIQEFFNNQEQYLDYIQEFVETSEETYSLKTINKWNRKIIENFNYVITAFTKQSYDYAEERLNAQKEMIYELGSPIISLSEDLAVRPLVGDIDTERAKRMIDSTLHQCVELGVKRLFIDLSGVLIIDTMVAYQIFQLIQALQLVGVNCTLSGMRPEIAQTAVQIGIDFENLSVVSDLRTALTSAKII
ncbi:STAS domain-containing protein [Priestia endophytica]|uniref:STAS domain-containing protein n=1 Tax=Priestia endophytica TaxID=135735 RepID=UPI0022802775|nr:STAS domain-containing protein [Priestia endophytica]MCY8233364.1 STAS domain-containing protein [Priestia endophytica]